MNVLDELNRSLGYKVVVVGADQGLPHAAGFLMRSPGTTAWARPVLGSYLLWNHDGTQETVVPVNAATVTAVLRPAVAIPTTHHPVTCPDCQGVGALYDDEFQLTGELCACGGGQVCSCGRYGGCPHEGPLPPSRLAQLRDRRDRALWRQLARHLVLEQVDGRWQVRALDRPATYMAAEEVVRLLGELGVSTEFAQSIVYESSPAL